MAAANLLNGAGMTGAFLMNINTGFCKCGACG
jgi:hypothetical protein